jgi:fused signal recognition particle receptor
MRAILAYPADTFANGADDHNAMASWFRRNKPDNAARPRLSIEELAAAFPDAPSTAPVAPELAPALAPIAPAPGIEASVVVAAYDAPVVAGSEPVADAVPHAIAETPVVGSAELFAAIIPDTVAEGAAHAHADSVERMAVPDRTAPVVAGWRERLRGSGFARTLGGLFSRNPKLDDELLDAIETALLTADVGVTASTQLVESLRKRMKAREFIDADALLRSLRADLIALLKPVATPLEIDRGKRPFVILTVGVNGVGKTTTIGKLARLYKGEGRSLMLAAGDTFRAAAVAQLQAWGERNGVVVIAQGQDADPASVAFDAMQAATARGIDVLIADTAGRLHTQQGLMAELGKIRRVIGKLDAGAPHEVLMVIDGTTGQNAISQVRQFNAAVNVTGLVVTKLDGTAKGGVVFALAREFGIPIRYAGIGEGPEDLRIFDAEAFVDALLPDSLAG